MNIFDKWKSWNLALEGSLRLEDDVKQIPGMAEARNVRDPQLRTEAIIDAMLMELERMKWLSGLVLQDSNRNMKICTAILVVSCMMDVGIIAFHLGLI